MGRLLLGLGTNNYVTLQQVGAGFGKYCAAPEVKLSVALDKHIDVTNHIDMNKNYSRAIPPAWKQMSRVFTALGDEHRQRILLTFEPGERLNVGQVAEVSTLSRSAVSHHLKVLREAGVLESRKEGKEVFFWVNKNLLREILGNVLDYVEHNS